MYYIKLFMYLYCFVRNVVIDWFFETSIWASWRQSFLKRRNNRCFSSNSNIGFISEKNNCKNLQYIFQLPLNPITCLTVFPKNISMKHPSPTNLQPIIHPKQTCRKQLKSIWLPFWRQFNGRRLCENEALQVTDNLRALEWE